MTATGWIKFYPSDWLGDVKLQACSLAARGLWIDLICIMHEATPYGHLLINGKLPSYYRIAQLVNADRKQVQRLMAQLKTRGILRVNSHGQMYSDRMVRDKLKSEQGQEFAKRRWGAGPNAPDTRKKERGLTEESKGRKNATGTNPRHRWENDLLKHYGPDAFAKIMDVLAANPAIVDRATRAERREPGSGAMAAILALRQNGATPQPLNSNANWTKNKHDQ